MPVILQRILITFVLAGQEVVELQGVTNQSCIFLSITIYAEASTMISLCAKNRRPRIIGAHKPGTMIMWTDFEDQKEEGLCNNILTYLEKRMLFFFSIVFHSELCVIRFQKVFVVKSEF